MKYFANIFIIVEDTFSVRYDMRQCIIKEFKLFTTFECPHEGTYILSKNCTHEYYGNHM